jgi:hypothetical protein
MFLQQLCLIQKSKINISYSGLLSYFLINLICHLCFEIGPNHTIRDVPLIRINDESMDERSQQVDFVLTQIVELSATSMDFHYKITVLPHKREADVTSPISSRLVCFNVFFSD